MHGPRKSTLIAGLSIFLIGIAGLAWSYWPAPRTSSTLVLSPDQLAQPGGNGTPAIEGRRILLDTPAWVRPGETTRITLSIIPDPPGAARPAVGMNVEAESWLELDGAAFSPDGVTSTALLAGRTSQVVWQVVPAVTNEVKGRAWLSFRFLPAGGAGDARRTMSAQPVAIRVISILGLPEGEMRALSGLFCVIGLALAAFSFRRRRKKNSRRQASRATSK